MVALSQISRLTIVGKVEGVKEATSDLRALASAQGEVAVASDKTEKATLSMERRFESIQRRLDADFRVTQDLARLQRDLDQARRQGLTTLDRQNDLMRLAETRARGMTAALNDNVRATGRVTNSFGLAGYQVRNLVNQFTDLGVQIGSGQGLFRPLLQQGPQIVDALGQGPGGIGGALAGLRAGFTAMPGWLKLALGATGLAGLATVAAGSVGALSGVMAKVSNEKGFAETVEHSASAVKRLADAVGEYFSSSSTFKSFGDVFISVANGIAAAMNNAAVATERANTAARMLASGIPTPLGQRESTAAENRRFAAQFPFSGPEYDREYGRRSFTPQTDNSYDGDSPSETARMGLDNMRRTLDRLAEEMDESGGYSQDMLGIQGRLQQAAEDQNRIGRDGLLSETRTSDGIIRVYDAAQAGVGATRDGATSVSRAVGDGAGMITRAIGNIRITSPASSGGSSGADSGSASSTPDPWPTGDTTGGVDQTPESWPADANERGSTRDVSGLRGGIAWNSVGPGFLGNLNDGGVQRLTGMAGVVSALNRSLGLTSSSSTSSSSMSGGTRPSAVTTTAVADGGTSDSTMDLIADRFSRSMTAIEQQRSDIEQRISERASQDPYRPDPYSDRNPEYFYREGTAGMTAAQSAAEDADRQQLRALDDQLTQMRAQQDRLRELRELESYGVRLSEQELGEMRGINASMRAGLTIQDNSFIDRIIQAQREAAIQAAASNDNSTSSAGAGSSSSGSGSAVGATVGTTTASYAGSFATGGEFTVRGRSGVDRNLIAMHASSGEVVSISRPGERPSGDRGGAPIFNVQFNLGEGADERKLMRSRAEVASGIMTAAGHGWRQRAA